MSRGTSQPQDNSSSEWVKLQIENLRRLLQEAKPWPETAELLLNDLSRIATSPHTTSPDEDYEMLSIVVNDALIGIDVMKKYPAFYARMLVDKELRAAFLDTLELLEESSAEDLSERSEYDVINVDFIYQVMSRPVVQRSAKNKLTLYWHRTAEQLQTMLYINTFRPREVMRSGNYQPGGGYINILQSQVEVEGQELEIRLEAAHELTRPGYLNLMIVLGQSEEMKQRFEATLCWGAYRETAEINQYGIAKFPSLQSDYIFTSSGELTQGLELHLEQIN